MLEAVRSHALIGVATDGVRDIVVTRASRTIPAKDVEDAIARALSARFDLGPTKDIAITFARDMRAMYVEPSSQGTLRVTQVEYDTRSGRFETTLEIAAGTGKRSVLHLAGRAVETVEVETVTRTIENGALKLSGCWPLVPVKSNVAERAALSIVIFTRTRAPLSIS